jgi:hypothetical protein
MECMRILEPEKYEKLFSDAIKHLDKIIKQIYKKNTSISLQDQPGDDFSVK